MLWRKKMTTRAGSRTPLLGETYKDAVSGFQGVVIGCVYYITGCNQALLQPVIKDNGEFVECRWVDFQRLAYVDVPRIELDNSKTPGFDIPAPRI